MSDQLPGQTIVDPDLDDVLEQLKTNIFATLNCIQIGKIEKVNDNQTCEIQIQMKRRVSGSKTIDYPLLVDCPYFVLSGGGSYIDMPVSEGDYCLILFNDRNIDSWWDTSNIVASPDRRKHNLSDGIALVGISPSTGFLEKDGTFVRILGTSGPGAEKEAARKDDETEVNAVTDSAFVVWMATVSSVLNVLAPGSIPNIPTTVTGKISTASMEVKIG